MALARVVAFDGVDSERMAQMRQEMEGNERPDDIPATEVIILHDPEASKSLAIVLFDNEEDYAKGDAALNAMPATETPGQRTSVAKYDVAVPGWRTSHPTPYAGHQERDRYESRPRRMVHRRRLPRPGGGAGRLVAREREQRPLHARRADRVAHAPQRPDDLCHRGRRPCPATRRGVEVIRPGDRVFFEPGEEHWHGAAPNRFMITSRSSGRRRGPSRHMGRARDRRGIRSGPGNR